jgi:hypothetical protein
MLVLGVDIAETEWRSRGRRKGRFKVRCGVLWYGSDGNDGNFNCTSDVKNTVRVKSRRCSLLQI